MRLRTDTQWGTTRWLWRHQTSLLHYIDSLPPPANNAEARLFADCIASLANDRRHSELRWMKTRNCSPESVSLRLAVSPRRRLDRPHFAVVPTDHWPLVSYEYMIDGPHGGGSAYVHIIQVVEEMAEIAGWETWGRYE